MAKNGSMGDVKENTQISMFTFLFLCNQVGLFAVAVFGKSVAAAVFFWLGIAFLLSRIEPVNVRYCALSFWLGTTLAILGYLVIPDVGTSNILEISDLKFWFGTFLLLMAAILIAITCYKMFSLPEAPKAK